MSDKLTVNEIFYSLDGEGIRAGYPAVFIRLAGCNLRCDYCDTGYALQGTDGKEMTIPEIIGKAKGFGKCRSITLTGGEPLLQNEAINLLRELHSEFDTIVETNGAVDIGAALPYASICMDWKIPSSGMNKMMLAGNLMKLRPVDCLKMVVRASDLPYTGIFLREHILRCPVYLSPVYGAIDLPTLADFVKGYQGPNTLRMQLQLHKIIWNPNERGV